LSLSWGPAREMRLRRVAARESRQIRKPHEGPDGQCCARTSTMLITRN